MSGLRKQKKWLACGMLPLAANSLFGGSSFFLRYFGLIEERPGGLRVVVFVVAVVTAVILYFRTRATLPFAVAVFGLAMVLGPLVLIAIWPTFSPAATVIEGAYLLGFGYSIAFLVQESRST